MVYLDGLRKNLSDLFASRAAMVASGLLVIVGLVFLFGSSPAQPSEPVTVPSNFFGLHVNGGAPTSLSRAPHTDVPDLGQRSIRLLNSYTSWRYLNPSQGVYNWRVLDFRVQQNEARGYSTVLSLGEAPDWVKAGWLHSNDPKRDAFLYQAWSNYLAAVGARYGNRIAYYEIWNEPDVGGFKGGTLPEMLELSKRAYKILKAAAPASKIISPAFSLPDRRSKHPVTLETFLEAGGGRYADMIAIHAYPGDGNPPEVLINRLKEVRRVVSNAGLSSMPILDTESGARGWRDETGRIRNIPPKFAELLPVSPIDLQSAYVSRTILIIAASGVVRQSYYFTFDNGDNTPGKPSVMAIGMTGIGARSDGLHRPALTYRYLAHLLPGATLSGLDRVDRHWELGIRTANGRKLKVYWCDDYRQDEIGIHAGSHVTDVTGKSLAVRSGTLRITASPVFVYATKN